MPFTHRGHGPGGFEVQDFHQARTQTNKTCIIAQNPGLSSLFIGGGTDAHVQRDSLTVKLAALILWMSIVSMKLRYDKVLFHRKWKRWRALVSIFFKGCCLVSGLWKGRWGVIFGFASFAFIREWHQGGCIAGCVSSKIPKYVTDYISSYQNKDQRVCVDRLRCAFGSHFR